MPLLYAYLSDKLCYILHNQGYVALRIILFVPPMIGMYKEVQLPGGPVTYMAVLESGGRWCSGHHSKEKQL